MRQPGPKNSLISKTPSPTDFTSPKLPAATRANLLSKRIRVALSFSSFNQLSNSGSGFMVYILAIVASRILLSNAYLQLVEMTINKFVAFASKI
jgi:hypothetical protein